MIIMLGKESEHPTVKVLAEHHYVVGNFAPTAASGNLWKKLWDSLPQIPFHKISPKDIPKLCPKIFNVGRARAGTLIII